MEAIVGSEQARSGFDYSQLDEATAKFAWQRAQEIRWQKEAIAQQLVEMGKKLIEVKERLPRGYWMWWLEDEFGWHPSYAQKLMQIALAFGDLDLSAARTSTTALRMVTTPSLPSEVIEDARRQLTTTGELSVDDARNIVRTVDPDLANYWGKRRGHEAQQIISHAAEFQAAVRNLQIMLSEHHDPVHPRVKRAVDKLTELIAVIMDTEGESEKLRFHTRKPARSSSKYWGVKWHTQMKKWQGQIHLKGDGPKKMIYLGLFDTEEAAARAYDAKARELYGDKARLNFSEE